MVNGTYCFLTFIEGPKRSTVSVPFTYLNTQSDTAAHLEPPGPMWGPVSFPRTRKQTGGQDGNLTSGLPIRGWPAYLCTPQKILESPKICQRTQKLLENFCKLECRLKIIFCRFHILIVVGSVGSCFKCSILFFLLLQIKMTYGFI